MEERCKTCRGLAVYSLVAEMAADHHNRVSEKFGLHKQDLRSRFRSLLSAALFLPPKNWNSGQN